jgi:hypothetical protein
MTMTEQQIKDGFERLDTALAPPLDAPDRVARRVAARRRRRRATAVGATAVLVVVGVGTAVALSGGDDGSETVAVDQPDGPVSTLAMTRPDGSTYAFPDVTVTCDEPYPDASQGPGKRIYAYSPRRITSDNVAAEPFVYVEALLDKVAGDRTFTFPIDSDDASADLPVIVFTADTDGNEAASSAGGESGTVRVLEASCDPVPVLRLQVHMTLGSEVGEQPLDVAGELR